jgi:hypothetical protein
MAFAPKRLAFTPGMLFRNGTKKPVSSAMVIRLLFFAKKVAL